jgi:hypothetical protein
VLPAVLLTLSTWSRGPSLAQDDYAQYLMHAEAILQGRAYTDIGYIYTDFNRFVGPAAEPPGFVWTLWLVLATVGAHPAAFKLLMLAGLVTFTAAAGRYFVHLDRFAALGVTALCGVVLYMDEVTQNLLPDLFFGAFVWLVALLVDAPGRWSLARVAALTAGGAAAVAYRLAGAPLIPALAVAWVLRRRELGVRPLVPLVAWSLTLLGTVWFLPTGEAVQRQFSDDLSSRLAVLAPNLWEYRWAVFSSHLYPFGSNRLNDGYHVLALVLMLYGWWRWRPSVRLFLVPFAALYMAMLLVTPAVDKRYMWPLYPLFVFGLLHGASAALSRARPGWPSARAHLALAGLFAALAGLALVRAEGQPRPATLTERADARELFALLARKAAEQPTRVVFFKPRTLAWHTGVPAMPPFSATPEETFGELKAKGITHVVLGNVGLKSPPQASFQALVQRFPDRFAFELRIGDFELYRFAR